MATAAAPYGGSLSAEDCRWSEPVLAEGGPFAPASLVAVGSVAADGIVQVRRLHFCLFRSPVVS
jgi:hypothetical protein